MAKAPDLAMRTRFASVDVLRGWAVAAMLLVNYPGSSEHVYAPLQHARWNGFTPTDLIFPAFLFVVGVSIALGLRPGTPPAKIGLRERGLRFLILMGLAMLALGGAWSLLIPLNKYLWTSSFVVFASGWSLLLLALCHALFDLRGWRPLGRSMGINAITAYAGSWLMACLMQRLGLFDAIWSRGFEPLLAPLFGAQAASLSFALAFVAFWWLAMWAMARRGWKLGV